MSSDDAPVNIARLFTTFNIEMRALPDDLKCAQCKSVLKDACQVPCGCRFCHTCIDHVVARGGQFCPGGSLECGRTPLSTVQRDFSANKSIMKLTAKCPHAGCTHECPLADMEGHLRVCPRKSVDCPFRELGCSHGGLAAADMSSHMQQESVSHSEILIGLVAGIKRDMEMLKDEQMRHLENEIKSMRDENKLIKYENESIRNDIKLISEANKSIQEKNESIEGENESMVAKINGDMEVLKQELVLKDEQGRHLENEIKSIKQENESMKKEIRSIKIENESIKREKAVLTEEVRLLADNLERERDERRQSDERASAGISAVTGAVASNRDALGTEMEPVRGEIRSINREQLDAMQLPVGLVQLADWLIDEDVGKTGWGWNNDAKTSTKFRGEGRPHTYELASWNDVSRGELWIWLRIWAGPSDAQLQWPFRGAVTITVAHRDNAEKYVRQTRQCQIKRPQDNQYRASEMDDVFKFKHAALRGAGLDLERGVRVSCQIVPGAGQ